MDERYNNWIEILGRRIIKSQVVSNPRDMFKIVTLTFENDAFIQFFVPNGSLGAEFQI